MKSGRKFTFDLLKTLIDDLEASYEIYVVV